MGNFVLRKATRKQVKLKIGLAGPAGSGKTMSALKMAYGMTGDWSKIGVLDTENRSSELYSDLGEFNVISFEPPFSPERYIEAINMLIADTEIEVIIIDSMSHEWEGKGGVLEIHNNMTGNSFTNWGKLTPRHNRFIDSIVQADKHIICTMRAKSDYVMTEKNGKQVPEKVGLKAITREGVDYEFTLCFDLDIKHYANASKDRTSLFIDKPESILSEEAGRKLLEWANSGEVADNRPVVNDKQFATILDRIRKGEEGLKEKTEKAFKMSDEQLDVLKATNKEVKNEPAAA